MRTKHTSLFGIAALAALAAAPLAAADTAMNRQRDLRTPPTDLGDNGMMAIDNGLATSGAGSTSMKTDNGIDQGDTTLHRSAASAIDNSAGHARLGI